VPAPLGPDGLRARRGGDWTEEKLYYLARYAAAFMRAMAPKRDAGKWDALVYIDLLAGPGYDVNRRTGEAFRGSPLIALNTVPRFDRIYLGDLKGIDVRTLEKRIPDCERARVEVERADCHDRAERIIAKLSGRTLGLAFVDPEGFEVGYRLLETLSRRAVDIVLLFPSGIGITRNIATFARAEDSPSMDALWNGPIWRQIPIVKAHAGKPLTRAEMDGLQSSWVSEYRKHVAKLGYVHHDSIGPLRNNEGAPMYHLLFFSKHSAGLTIWRGIRELKPDGSRFLPGFIRDDH
jgi:three-Cys-motif partner protein